MAVSVDVLVVEDDIWLSEQFERTLIAAGYTVGRAFEGHTAMDLIDELRPKIILLDMLLTGSTAVTLLHELQSYSDTAGIPIVLCTNLAATITIDDVSVYGVRRILDKTTMHPDDVTTAVRSVLL
ncbi:response regulator [bacterium]|nr:MAG: response regulator [bacterium]